jgi:hypothetical protein
MMGLMNLSTRFSHAPASAMSASAVAGVHLNAAWWRPSWLSHLAS